MQTHAMPMPTRRCWHCCRRNAGGRCVVCCSWRSLSTSCSWEDGELVQKRLQAPSRWDVHSAEEVAVTLGGDVRIRILQQV